MLGKEISDPDEVEEGGSIRGMELLDASTILQKEKKRTQIEGKLPEITGTLSGLSNKSFTGYEIHMGETLGMDVKENIAFNKNVYGTYIHGIFDNGEIVNTIVETLAKIKGVKIDVNAQADIKAFKDSQYDLLAMEMRKHMNMEEVYKMLREACI